MSKVEIVGGMLRIRDAQRPEVAHYIMLSTIKSFSVNESALTVMNMFSSTPWYDLILCQSHAEALEVADFIANAMSDGGAKKPGKAKKAGKSAQRFDECDEDYGGL